MFWKTLGPAHMCSINHLYNACHIKKLLYDCGPQSVSAVLKLAWSQDNHPGSSSHHHHQSIYGGHTCLLVRVWMWVRGWQLRSFMDLTCTGWGDAKDTFEERPVTFRKSDRPTKQHGIVVREALVAKLGWFPVTDCGVQNPSPFHCVMAQCGKTGSRRRLFRGVFWSGCTCWTNSWNQCFRNTGWPTALNPPVPDLSPWHAQLEDKGWLSSRIWSRNHTHTKKTQFRGYSQPLRDPVWSLILVLLALLPENLLLVWVI